MHRHFIPHRTRILPECIVCLQSRCSLCRIGAIYTCSSSSSGSNNNNNSSREREHFLVVLKQLSDQIFNREWNHFISINQQNYYWPYLIKQALLQSSLECQQIQHMLTWLSVLAIFWIHIDNITNELIFQQSGRHFQIAKCKETIIFQ